MVWLDVPFQNSLFAIYLVVRAKTPIFYRVKGKKIGFTGGDTENGTWTGFKIQNQIATYPKIIFHQSLEAVYKKVQIF